MRRTKRFASFALAACMGVSLLVNVPAGTVSAAEPDEVVSAEATETDAEALDEMQEAVYDESEADADGFKWNGTAIVGYVGKGGDVKIPEKCTSIGSSAFKGCDNLTSIVIPKGVTSIGSFAFMDCTGMASVEMPEGVTSIGHHAFWGCYKLKNIEIPVSVTSIGKYAFYDCSRFADINIPANVTSIGVYAFRGCGGMNGPTSIVVSPENTTYNSNGNCNAIIETKTNKLIQGCMNTKIPMGVTSIGDSAFADCVGLKNIEIPVSVTSIGNKVFMGCYELTGIKIPTSVTSIGDSAFWNCHCIKNVEIPASVKSIGSSPFIGCQELSSIIVSPENATYNSNDNCNAIIETKTNKLIQGCKDTKIPTSVTSIGNSAFAYCSELTSIEIPKSITSIGKAAFDQSGLKTIYGDTGSYAEAYAKENGYTFKAIEEPVADITISYRTHVQSIGWQNPVTNGVMSGTTGEAKRLEAIRIELTGTISSYYDVYYRVHAQSYGWMGWAKNGETAGTAGLGKRLEAIQICLVEKGSDAPNALPAASNAKAYQGTPEPVDNSIIYVYSWNTELGERLEYFKDKYPQYADKVKFENLGLGGTSDEYKKEIEAAYQKGGQKVPSIVAMDEGVTKYFMSSDMFVNMDSIGITQKDYSNAFQYTIDHATVNGKLKGLCWQATPGCFVYRTDIAQKVLGTSDPAKVQTYVKDWDTFMQTAEKMKQAGYKMVSGPKEIQNAALADRKSAWVNDGTVTIDPAVDKYLELAMQLIDNGYTNKNDPWTDGWQRDFTGDVFGYFGCPWFVYWSINDEESGSATAGKRNICAGPSAYNWGGTYLSVTDKCPNKELAALVLKTLCCDTDVMYKIQDETLDFVNNKAAVQKMIANGKGATPILGGANPLQTWYNVAVKVDGSKATQYDSVFEGYLYTLIDGYENGYNESKDNMKSMLKAMIKDGYPNLTVK